MKKNSGLNLLYKYLGETPLETITRFKKDNPEYINESMTYAGRLDPMAEGLLIVLSGDEIKDKGKYQDLPKTYEFEVLWGVETDTLDLLGLVVKSEKLKVERKKIEEYLKNSVGKFEQKYPAYSSKPVSGKSLFQWAREGRIGEVDIPSHEVLVFEINFLERRNISGSELLKDVEEKISKVSGDFRQKEILNEWRKVLNENLNIEFTIDKIEAKVSSGFYVRQFVNDLAKTFGTTATTFHIKRTKVGGFIL